MTSYPFEVRITTYCEQPVVETSASRERKFVDAYVQTEASMIPFEPPKLPKSNVAQYDDAKCHSTVTPSGWNHYYRNPRCHPDTTHEYPPRRLEDAYRDPNLNVD
jgi:hypothetical protein